MKRYLIKSIATATKENTNWYKQTDALGEIVNGVSIHYIGVGTRVLSGLYSPFAYKRKGDAERCMKQMIEMDDSKMWDYDYSIIEVEC